MATDVTKTGSYTKVSQTPAFAADGKRDRQPKVFNYRAPQELTRNRAFVPLVRSDILFAMVQVIKKGGEQELHSHAELDGYWMVLKGCARFYGEGDVLLAELGPHDGIFIPRNTLYWFEAVGDEVLELLQVEAVDKTVKAKYYTPDAKPIGEADVYTPDGGVIGLGLRVE